MTALPFACYSVFRIIGPQAQTILQASYQHPLAFSELLRYQPPHIGVVGKHCPYCDPQHASSAPELLKSSLNSKEPQYVQHTLAQDFNDCHRSRDCDSLRLCDIACHGWPSAASDFARSSATLLAPAGK